MASNQLPEAAIGTRCIHAGLMHDEFGSASPAIYQTSTFVFENTAQGSARFAGKEPGYIYSRMANPTNKMLEDSVTALEQGYSSMCCATGMGAVNVVFLALLKAGDHVVCGRSVYGCTHAILENLYPKFGVTCSFVDSSSLEAIKAGMCRDYDGHQGWLSWINCFIFPIVVIHLRSLDPQHSLPLRRVSRQPLDGRC